MDMTPIIETITPLGLVALMIFLGYYAVQKIGNILTQHYQRQTELLNQINITMMACAQRLQDIEESFQKLDRL